MTSYSAWSFPASTMMSKIIPMVISSMSAMLIPVWKARSKYRPTVKSLAVGFMSFLTRLCFEALRCRVP